MLSSKLQHPLCDLEQLQVSASVSLMLSQEASKWLAGFDISQRSRPGLTPLSLSHTHTLFLFARLRGKSRLEMKIIKGSSGTPKLQLHRAG